MDLLGLLFIIIAIWLYNKVEKRLSNIEKQVGGTERIAADRRLGQLEKRIKSVEGWARQIGSEPTATAQPAPDAREEAPLLAGDEIDQPEEVGAASVTESERVIPPDADAPTRAVRKPTSVGAGAGARSRAAAPPMRPPSRAQERWNRIEKQVIENWTGILGAAALVAGITFIGGYTGLRMSPFYRSLMIVAAAAALGAGSYVLARKERWEALSQWLRSAGAAVFLFACFGSSAIPGLQWVTSLAPALGILSLGVAANLYAAHATGKQAFASLHVVLSLIPLTLVPQSEVSIALATVVVAVGIAMAYRTRWDLHTLVTLAAFALFHVTWYGAALATTATLTTRVIGVISAITVAVFVALMHYRKTYASERIETLPFLVHLGNWAMLGTALAVYVGNTPMRGVTLLGAAVVVFFLARHGRSLGIRWIYLTDTLIAQALALVGVISFYPFVYHWLLVPAVVFLQTALFLKVGIDEDEELLEKTGIYLVHLSAAVLAVSGVVALDPDQAIRNQNAALLLVTALLGAVVHLYLTRVRGESFDSVRLYGSLEPYAERISLLGAGVGIIATAALVNLIGGRWVTPAGFGATATWVLMARRWSSSGLSIAAWLTIVPAHLIAWALLYSQHPSPALDQLLYHLGPLVLASAAAVTFASRDGVGHFLRHTAIYLLGITVAIATYTLLQPVSSLVPGIVWLSLSLLTLELANRLSSRHIAPLLHIGYAYLACFAGAYTLVVLQTQAYWGPIPVRTVIEGYALAIVGFWWLFRPTDDLASHGSWRAVHPLFLELALAFVAVVTVVEVAPPWRPLFWIGIALLAATRRVIDGLDSRFGFYALLFYWISILDLVIVTSGFSTPSPRWYQHPGFTGGLAIALQVLFLATTSRRLRLGEVAFPRHLANLAGWSKAIARRQHLWLYYPFFVGIALFLYWRFEAALLTLLWSAEAFVVSTLSLVLRESHFRYMALAGLAACVIRLLVVDMAQANLGLRGVVFIGVGMLMLGMNAMYNKYRDRFS